MGNLKVTTPSDREIAMTRVFDAPRTLVFDAHTKPDLVRLWLLGPPGWSMPVCEMDVRVGGTYRWVWRHDRDGTTMGMGGVDALRVAGGARRGPQVRYGEGRGGELRPAGRPVGIDGGSEQSSLIARAPCKRSFHSCGSTATPKRR